MCVRLLVTHSLVKPRFERCKLRPQLDHSELGVGVPVVLPYLGETFAVVFQVSHRHFETLHQPLRPFVFQRNPECCAIVLGWLLHPAVRIPLENKGTASRWLM